MSKIREWLSDPQVHLLLSGLAQAVKAFYPPAAAFFPVLDAITGVLTVTSFALPENGSMHKADYLNLAKAIADATRPQVETTAGRS